MGGNHVAHQSEDGHNYVLGHRHNVGTSDFSDCDTAIGLVCSVEINVIGPDTGSDGDLQVLGFRKALSSEVTWMEANRFG